MKSNFPKSLPEFHERFRYEDACLQYLRCTKWPDGFRCPKCAHGRSYLIADRKVDLSRPTVSLDTYSGSLS